MFLSEKKDKIKSRFNCTIALADQIEFNNWEKHMDLESK